MKRPTKPPVKPSWDQAAVNPVPRLDGGAVLPATEVDGDITYPKPVFPPGFFYENAAFYNSDLSLEMWCQHVGMTFQMARDVLGRDLPPETDIRVFIHGTEIQMTMSHPDKELSEDRTYWSIEKRMGSGNTVLSLDNQGSGMGALLLRNQIEWGYLLGMTHLLDTAGNDLGGWVWARKGFPLNLKAYPNDLIVLRQRLKHRLSIIKNHLEVLTHPELKTWTLCGDRNDLIRIADLEMPLILPVDVSGGDSRKDQILKNICGLLPGESEDDVHDKILDLMPFMERQLFERKKPVTVGQFMLVGTAWPIRIDFDDAKVMTRLGQTLGGWKYIDPGTGKSVKRDVAPAP